MGGLCFLLMVPAATNSAQHVVTALPQPAPKFQTIRVDVSRISSLGVFGSSDQGQGKLVWVGGGLNCPAVIRCSVGFLASLLLINSASLPWETKGSSFLRAC